MSEAKPPVDRPTRRQLPLSREIPLEPDQSALLIIDVQNYCCHERGGEFHHLSDEERTKRFGYFFECLRNTVVPNIKRLQAGFRQIGMEVIYTSIESLTQDGRDRSLDYKISGLNVSRGSWDAKVIDDLTPTDNEIVIPKTSSSVFISTNMDYVLRNLGVTQLVLCGVATEQCVESAVRDACDLGYLVTLVPNACASYSWERHSGSLQAIGGYCRQVGTEDLLAEIRSQCLPAVPRE